MNETRLRRAISLPQLLLYGLGTMVGGGFYALSGKVAGVAGMFTPVAFLVAGLLALLNAFTFAELSARLPFSAGEARYVQEAFRRKWLATLVGCLVIATGVVSAGTLAVATATFLKDLVAVPERLTITLLVVGMGMVAAWGVGESVALVVIITFVEVATLVYVVIVAGGHLHELPERLPEITAGFSVGALSGILSGAFLGFYAFIGFEDMVNMAEEVKDVRHTLPRAILVSVALTTLLYVVVSLVAVLAVSPAELARANTPFVKVLGSSGGTSKIFIVIVSMLTGINGALVQIIMSARVAYGMAVRSKAAPAWLADVNPRTQTPVKSTALMTCVVLFLALFFPLVTLAKATSTIILVVFSLVNLSLWRMKRRRDPAPGGAPSYPTLFPVMALAACFGLLAFHCWSVLAGIGS